MCDLLDTGETTTAKPVAVKDRHWGVSVPKIRINAGVLDMWGVCVPHRVASKYHVPLKEESHKGESLAVDPDFDASPSLSYPLELLRYKISYHVPLKEESQG